MLMQLNTRRVCVCVVAKLCSNTELRTATTKVDMDVVLVLLALNICHFQGATHVNFLFGLMAVSAAETVVLACFPHALTLSAPKAQKLKPLCRTHTHTHTYTPNKPHITYPGYTQHRRRRILVSQGLPSSTSIVIQYTRPNPHSTSQTQQRVTSLNMAASVATLSCEQRSLFTKLFEALDQNGDNRVVRCVGAPLATLPPPPPPPSHALCLSCVFCARRTPRSCATCT